MFIFIFIFIFMFMFMFVLMYRYETKYFNKKFIKQKETASSGLNKFETEKVRSPIKKIMRQKAFGSSNEI
jgi:hypothetical protein